MITAVEIATKSIRLKLPANGHQTFRVESAKNGQSMAEVARRLVEEWLATRGKNVGK